MKKIVVAVSLMFLLMVSVSAVADTLTFTLVPATVGAYPGETTGWGYTLTNNSADWVMADNLTPDATELGTFDLSVFDFPILAPGATTTVFYDGVQGLASFTWDPSVGPKTLVTGVFTLDFSLWDGDPFSGANFVDSGSTSAKYSVIATPEPGTIMLLGTGFLGMIAATRKKLFA